MCGCDDGESRRVWRVEGGINAFDFTRICQTVSRGIVLPGSKMDASGQGGRLEGRPRNDLTPSFPSLSSHPSHPGPLPNKEADTYFSHRLLIPKHPLLPLLAAQFPFEIAIGMNGRIWFKAGSVDQTIALRRVLDGAAKGRVEFTAKEVGRMVKGMT